MDSNRVLKVDYMSGLRFKHLDGVWFNPDIVLDLSYEESLILLDKIRGCLHERSSRNLVDVGKYSIMIESFDGTAFSMSITENSGEMCRPLGSFRYDSYMQGRTMLRGLSSAMTEIRDEMGE